MKPLATALVVAIGLASVPVLCDAEASRDLWIGVLQGDLLVPIASLVNGRWGFLDKYDDAQRQDLYDAEGKLPARWLDGRALPHTWRTHLISGATKLVHVVGPLTHNRYDDEQRVVRTDSGLVDTDSWPNVHGVAIDGAVNVRFFHESPESDRPAMARFLATRAAQEARAAIKRKGASSDWDAKAWADLSDKAIDARAFEVNRMVAMKQRDGSETIYIEQITQPMDDSTVLVRATVSRSKAGALRLIEMKADTGTENYVGYDPLAILERDGVSCWLTIVVYEDGVEYVLAQPHHVVNDCRLK